MCVRSVNIYVDIDMINSIQTITIKQLVQFFFVDVVLNRWKVGNIKIKWTFRKLHSNIHVNDYRCSVFGISLKNCDRQMSIQNIFCLFHPDIETHLSLIFSMTQRKNSKKNIHDAYKNSFKVCASLTIWVEQKKNHKIIYLNDEFYWHFRLIGSTVQRNVSIIMACFRKYFKFELMRM